MAMPKLPMQFANVPESVLALQKHHPHVVAFNLLPNQCPIRSLHTEQAFPPYNFWMDKSVLRFLKLLPADCNVVMLLQEDGIQLSTMVVPINNIYWLKDGLPSDPDYPRLEFGWPANAPRFFDTPNLWGAFIVAIALIHSTHPPMSFSDPACQHFDATVSNHGVSWPQSIKP